MLLRDSDLLTRCPVEAYNRAHRRANRQFAAVLISIVAAAGFGFALGYGVYSLLH